jgi:hypothetical protein
MNDEPVRGAPTMKTGSSVLTDSTALGAGRRGYIVLFTFDRSNGDNAGRFARRWTI